MANEYTLIIHGVNLNKDAEIFTGWIKEKIIVSGTAKIKLIDIYSNCSGKIVK